MRADGNLAGLLSETVKPRHRHSHVSARILGRSSATHRDREDCGSPRLSDGALDRPQFGPILKKSNLTVLDHGEHPEVPVEQQCEFYGGPSMANTRSIGIL